jgi:DNA-directed RNA polymerase
LRDDVGGNVVNLTPTEEKSDVYAEVAIVVNRILNKDLQEGGDKGKYAKMWLDVGVDRKICKRNVMTFCYGATRAGFTQQLISLDLKENLGLPIDSVMQACNYLGGVNWTAVAETLVKSVEAMKLLQKLAFFMAKRNYDVQWSNSVGLRVTQDYRKTKTKQIETWWGGIKIYPSIVELTNQKDTVGSRNGIAPNYIHSLDASHLMLTAMKCAEEGVTSFSFIHDSFGTHAADMETMSRILRETFVEMYSENLLDKFIVDVREQLYPEHQEDYDKLVNEFKPEMGSLDIQDVKGSLYVFS